MDKCLFISKGALEYNINYYLEKSNKDLIAVIKNNAYGHGVKEILSILEGLDVKLYAVSNLKEASEVNQYTNKDILIMDKIDHYDLLKENMILTIISKKHLKRMIDLDIPIRVHLKINVSMKRKGIEESEIEECLSLIKASKLKLEGIYTHYSSYRLKHLKKEFSKFKSIIDRIDTNDLMVHASSSISSLLLKENVTSAIRVGVGMYGLKKVDKVMNPLKIVSELKCFSQNSYPIKCFDKFSYNNTYLGKKGYVVMANLGYGDGLFYKKKIKGYIENGYIREIGIRNMDNMYFYSRDYIMDNSVIEIYGKNNKLDDLSKKTKIAVCRLLALLNESIEKEIVD